MIKKQKKTTTTEGPVMPISIPNLKRQIIRLTLIGDSPLICHKWSDVQKKRILDKQMMKAKTGKMARNIEQEYKDSLYPHPDGGYGFPSIALKKAAVDAAAFIDGAKKTEMRGSFHIEEEFVKLEGKPSRREDSVRIGMGTGDLRYRAEFKTWKTTLNITYNTSVISADQIVNLFNNAGFSIGIGDWRPQKNGTFGRFSVKTKN